MCIERRIEDEHNTYIAGHELFDVMGSRKSHSINSKDETGNKIGAEGACALSQALKVNAALKILKFGSEYQQQLTARVIHFW